VKHHKVLSYFIVNIGFISLNNLNFNNLYFFIHFQEAFFGKDLLDTTKETSQDLESSSDDSDDGKSKVNYCLFNSLCYEFHLKNPIYSFVDPGND
jgi:hypothetical protein